jgi:hypothetical protein
MRNLVFAIIFALGVAAPASAINLLPEASFVTANASNVATFNTDAAVVTTQSLTTVAQTGVTFTINCSAVDTTSLVMATVGNGTNTTGTPTVGPVTPGNGVITIVIFNDAAAAAFNGTLTISIVVFN